MVNGDIDSLRGTMTEADRLLSWDACLNARDVGGYATADGGRVRRRALLRSDSLCRLTPAGQAALVADGVRTIIDLRSPSELDLEPHPFAAPEQAGAAGGASAGVPRYLSLPLFDEDDMDAWDELAEVDDSATFYGRILDLFQARVGRVVAAVADAPAGGVLVHCFVGKDRTGLVTALLLEVAGVPRETIAADYALSDTYLQPLLAEMLAPLEDPAERDSFVRTWRTRPETMLATLAHLDARYGGVELYLRGAGVTEAQIEHIRGRLREGANHGDDT